MLLSFSTRPRAWSSSRRDLLGLGPGPLLRNRPSVSRSVRPPRAVRPLLPSAGARGKGLSPPGPEPFPWALSGIVAPVQFLDTCHLLPVFCSTAVYGMCVPVLSLKQPHPCVLLCWFAGIVTRCLDGGPLPVPAPPTVCELRNPNSEGLGSLCFYICFLEP